MSDEALIKKYVPTKLQAQALKDLNSGLPVQYIIGNVDFYGSIINVNENVLIPRFETEYLVDKTIKYLKKAEKKNIEILEIGTGSGCISIALKKNLKCNVLAIDISKKAVETAQNNASSNNVDIEFLIEDINKFSTKKKFDLIISNPPYVPYSEKVDEKTKYEPQNAIFAPENGIFFYKIIMERLKNNLKDDYLIAFEIGDKQGMLVTNIIKEKLPNSYIKVEKDYNNFERYVFASSENLFE